MVLATSPQSAVSGITLRQLQYFIAVAEDEHFTRASERLLIAQTSLSRQVRDLEDAIGVDLFVRDTRGVTLTEAGRELLARAQEIFAVLERTVDAVRSKAAGESGQLRLGYYGPSFYNNDVTRLTLERFQRETPNVEVTSEEMFTDQAVVALREGRIDVGFARKPPHGLDIESRVIGSERLIVLIPESHHLASQHEVSLADLDGLNHVTFATQLTSGCTSRIAEIASSAGVTLNTIQVATQLSTIAYHVACGEVVSVLPASSALFDFPGVVTRHIIDSEATVELLALTRRGESSPAVLRFIGMLLD